MTAFVYGILLFLFSVLLRGLFLLREETTFSDSVAHRWLIHLRRASGDMRQHDVPGSLIKGYRGYPPLMHWMMMRFFPESWEFAAPMLTICADAANVVLMYTLALLLGMEAETAFCLGLILSTTPILLPGSARLSGIGARTLGGLLYSLFLLFLALHLLLGWWWPLLPAVAAALTILISSQFAMQMLVWTCLVLSPLLWTPVPLLLLAAACLLALLPCFDGGRLAYRKVKHFQWYREYLRRNPGTNYGVPARNRWRTTVAPLKNILHTPRLAVRGLLTNNSWAIAAYSLPVGWVLLWLLATGGPILGQDGLWADPAARFLLCVLMATVSAFVLTSLPPLLILGEAERYFEYGAGAMTLLAGLAAARADVNLTLVTPVLVCVNLTVVLLQLFTWLRPQLERRFRRPVSPTFDELASFLQSFSHRRIATLPTKMAFALSPELDASNRYYFDNICVSGEGMEYMHRDHIRLHYLRPEPEYLKANYGIDLLVIDRLALRNAEYLGIDYSELMTQTERIFENDGYLVHDMKGQAKTE